MLVAEEVESVPETAPAWQRKASQINQARWFQILIVAVIVANAIIIGVNTFKLDSELAGWLMRVDVFFLTVFTVELIIRMAADGFNLRKFFGNGWNTFDFFVVAICFVPGISTSATALRIARLLRVSRLLRIMPDAKVLLRGLRRAAPPAFSLLALTVLFCYLYAVVGWMIFHGRTPPDMPDYFGNIGEAMLTLFELLTLEGWNSVLHDLRQVSGWALPYVISFLLIGTYIVVNLVVGIVITSLDETYKEHDREQRRLAHLRNGASDDPAETLVKIQELMELLEDQLERYHGIPDPDGDSAEATKAAARLL